MMPSITSPQQSHRTSSPSRTCSNLLTRLRKPFTQKVRNIAEFYIQPDDQYRLYGPGDVATGHVVLKIAKHIDITHIVVCLHGFAQVYKTPNSPGEGYRNYNSALIAGKTNKAGGYYGNGFASLWEDEVTLCGDGRLEEGQYQFGYELHFPEGHSPSSIDFERGTVTYMITSTLTRPTRASIMHPVTTCERRVTFIDDINVADLMPPKPRVITLEPIITRSKTRARRQPHPLAQDGSNAAAHPNTSTHPTSPAASTTPTASTTTTATTAATAVDPNRLHAIESASSSTATQSQSQTLAQSESDAPRSPGPSETSFETTISSGGTPSGIESTVYTARTVDSRPAQSHLASPSDSGTVVKRKPIVATLEIQSSGYLRGDSIEVKVHISHTKQVRSLHGVIVTLFRQARVDFYPSLPVVSSKARDKDDDGDLSHRSRMPSFSGLGLTSGGSCHLYRKDLDQSFASIIINPETMSTEVKTTVQVPEDSFPTISTVPGAMISFKYYVEVILDLNGKLTALDKYLPSPGASNMAAYRGMPALGGWGATSINTEEIRRAKSVVHSQFEVVIGSRDSGRKGQWKEGESSRAGAVLGEDSVGERMESSTSPVEANPGPNSNGVGLQVNGNGRLGGHFGSPAPEYEDLLATPVAAANFARFVEEEAELPEKERLRRAEERLMPSAPPMDDAGASGSNGVHANGDADAPSAPTLPLPMAPWENGAMNGHEAPAYHAHVRHSNHERIDGATETATEDKGELERRRLESLRSAPPMPDPSHTPRNESENGERAGANALPSLPSVPTGINANLLPSAPPGMDDASSAAYAPTAPIMAAIGGVEEEEEVFGLAMGGYHHEGPLPRYER